MAMENKGLCVTCVSDKDCTFPRKFPVIQCQEFSDESRKHGRSRKARIKK
jgi:hypothetical protein